MIDEEIQHILRNRLQTACLCNRLWQRATDEIWDYLNRLAGKDVKNPDAQIIRLEKSKEGVIGILMKGNKVLCFTLESYDKHIPFGAYECIRVNSPKFGETFEIKVPHRTYIRFHWGNFNDDTEGCPLLGMTVGYIEGKRAILSSKRAFKKFMEEFKNINKFILDVIDFL